MPQMFIEAQYNNTTTTTLNTQSLICSWISNIDTDIDSLNAADADIKTKTKKIKKDFL